MFVFCCVFGITFVTIEIGRETNSVVDQSKDFFNLNPLFGKTEDIYLSIKNQSVDYLHNQFISTNEKAQLNLLITRLEQTYLHLVQIIQRNSTNSSENEKGFFKDLPKSNILIEGAQNKKNKFR